MYFIYNPELLYLMLILCNNNGKYGLSLSPLMIDPQFGNKDFFATEVSCIRHAHDTITHDSADTITMPPYVIDGIS